MQNFHTLTSEELLQEQLEEEAETRAFYGDAYPDDYVSVPPAASNLATPMLIQHQSTSATV